MQYFKAVLENSCGDPICDHKFLVGAHIEAGQILETADGLAVILSIEATDIYEGALLAIECEWQFEEQIKESVH
jgi:hypothetical protein